ncbi:MAG: 3-hydroxybutyrate oligomer hydrolase family protein, partial [Xanthobacteraceae bacterium]
AETIEEARKPTWLGVVQTTTYDGKSDDLVTAGFGAAALSAAVPAVPLADRLHPTAAELRRAAIATHLDPGEGFGRLFGPDIDEATGTRFDDDGRIPGTEYLAFADNGSGRENVAMLLQVPASFDPETNRCILVVPISGSSGVYKNVVDLGFWGLRRSCAVVYTDKGLGNGFHDLDSDTVGLISGERVPAAEADGLSQFTADLDAGHRQALALAYPHRIAFKHAHSRQNPEATWGRDVVRAAQFAFYQLNEEYGAGRAVPPLTRANTTVIATGISNGGGAALYGAEADTGGWIDGFVAAEPQVQVKPDDRVSATRAGRAIKGSGRPLADYFSFAILYQPCAAVATPDAPLRSTLTFAENRCQSLKDKGLLTGANLEAQAREALDKLRDYGWEPESDILHASHYAMAPDATAAKYLSDHGRFGVEDRLCGFSFAAVDEDGRPTTAPADLLATIFATAPGGAPAGAIDIVNDLDPTGPRRNAVSASPSSKQQDYNLDGALCLRELAVGTSADARRVQDGVREFLTSADTHGKPVIIVHGRADARVPVAFSSRPYVALNSLIDGPDTRVRYIELANVQHFGTTIPGYDSRFVSILPYQLQALDLMYAALTEGTPLPPSQVVHPVPRGGEPGHAPPLSVRNLPPISMDPAPEARISVAAGAIEIPE